MISRHLLVLLACLCVVMIGLGITMPVLPFYAYLLSGALLVAVAVVIGWKAVQGQCGAGIA